MEKAHCIRIFYVRRKSYERRNFECHKWRGVRRLVFDRRGTGFLDAGRFCYGGGGFHQGKKALYTGHIGDGKIFVYNVDKVVKVRTGEEDFAALQDVE